MRKERGGRGSQKPINNPKNQKKSFPFYRYQIACPGQVRIALYGIIKAAAGTNQEEFLISKWFLPWSMSGGSRTDHSKSWYQKQEQQAVGEREGWNGRFNFSRYQNADLQENRISLYGIINQTAYWQSTIFKHLMAIQKSRIQDNNSKYLRKQCQERESPSTWPSQTHF